jgi:hypothetical protein
LDTIIEHNDKSIINCSIGKLNSDIG